MSDPPTDARSIRLPAWLAGGPLRWWLLAAFALILLVRALLPWGLARVAESQGSKQMGRVVQIGDVDLDLVRGRIAVADVVVGPLLERIADPEAPIDPDRVLLSFARLGVELSWSKLLTGELRLVEVSLDRPRAQIIRGKDGDLVPIRIAPAGETEAEEEADEEPSEPGPPLPIVVDTLRFSGIELLLLDLAHRRLPIELEMKELALADLRLERGTMTLASLDLESPSVKVLRDADFATRFQGAKQEAAEAAGASEEEPGTPPAVRIAHVGLDRAEFSLVVGEETLVATLGVSADDVSLDEGQRFPLTVDLGIAPGKLRLEGEAGVIPPSFAGTLAWNGLELGPLLRAAVPDAPLSIASGTSEGTLEIDALLAGKPEHGASHLTLSGRAAVQGFDAREAQDRLALAWQGLEVVIDRIHTVPPSADAPTPAPEIALASLDLTAPQVKLKRSAPEAPAAVPEAAAPAVEPAAAEAPPAGNASQPHLTLARLEVTGGVLELNDAAVSPPHRSEYRDITVRATDVHWPDVAFGSLEASLLGPQGSEVALQGVLERAVGDLDIDVKKLPLPGYSPYAVETAGYWLEAGTLSLDAKASIEGKTVTLDSDVYLRNLDVAEVRPGTFDKQFGMSLDLALALLRDPFGGIHLPVNGSFGPEPGGGLSPAPIVAGALRQALLGAMTTPIKGLGLLVPGAGRRDEGMLLQPVAFAPGALVPDGESQLPGLVKLLEERPGLALVLRGRAGSEDDRYLAIRMLAEAAASGSELPAVGAARAGFFERRRLLGALEDYAKGDEQALAGLDAEDVQLLDRWVAEVEVPESRREELARTRAKGLRDELVNQRGVDAERVRVGDPLAGEPAVLVELAPAG